MKPAASETTVRYIWPRRKCPPRRFWSFRLWRTNVVRKRFSVPGVCFTRIIYDVIVVVVITIAECKSRRNTKCTRERVRPYATATLCDWSTCSLQNEPQMNEIFFEMNQILTGFIHYATHQRSRVAKIKEIDAIIKMKKRGEGTKRKSATFMRPGPVSRVKETLCSAAGESRSRAYLTGRRLPAHRPPVLRVAVFFSSSSLSLSLPKTAATCLAYQVITAEKGPLLQFCCSLPLSFISFSFLSAFRLDVNKIETISVVRRMKSDRPKKIKISKLVKQSHVINLTIITVPPVAQRSNCARYSCQGLEFRNDFNQRSGM